eukprot:1676133-Prymnesium_polylepis.1
MARLGPACVRFARRRSLGDSCVWTVPRYADTWHPIIFTDCETDRCNRTSDAASATTVGHTHARPGGGLGAGRAAGGAADGATGACRRWRRSRWSRAPPSPPSRTSGGRFRRQWPLG